MAFFFRLQSPAWLQEDLRVRHPKRVHSLRLKPSRTMSILMARHKFVTMS